jgi:hypothetical protein
MDLAWHDYTELREVGGVRYSARILELKRLGYQFEDEPLEPQGKRYRLLDRVPSGTKGKKVKVYISEQGAQALLDGTITNAVRLAVTDALGSFQANKHKL